MQVTCLDAMKFLVLENPALKVDNLSLKKLQPAVLGEPNIWTRVVQQS